MGINVQDLSRADQNNGIKFRAQVQSERDGRRFYHVVRQHGKWTCSCPNAIYRRPAGGCKHIRAVKAIA